MLSISAIQKLIHAVGTHAEGNEVANAINAGISLDDQTGVTIPALIVATTANTTTDFTSLAVGDHVLHIPAASGSIWMQAVVTAGTSPTAAVVGDFYIVFRAWMAPASV